MAAVPPGAARRVRRFRRFRAVRTGGPSAALLVTAPALVALLATGCSGGTQAARTVAGDAPTSASAPSSSSSSSSARATTPSPTPAPTGTGKAVYVALGDSYVAGPGIPNRVGTPAGCERSDHAYPALVAQGLGLPPSEYRSAACIGATADDLAGSEHTFNGANPPQLDALTADTRVVTLGIGGNDVDVVGVVLNCLALDEPAKTSANPDPAPCRTKFTVGGDQLGRRIAATADQVADALTQIARRAPHAKVFVVGYPELVPDGGTMCAQKLDLTPDDVAFLYEQEVRLNAMLRDRAHAAGAFYVDTFTPSAGLNACADPGRRWVEPLIPASTGTTLHPNVAGEQGMADAVVAAVRKAG